MAQVKRTKVYDFKAKKNRTYYLILQTKKTNLYKLRRAKGKVLHKHCVWGKATSKKAINSTKHNKAYN